MSVLANQSKFSTARAHAGVNQHRRLSRAYGALWSAGVRDIYGNLPSGSEILFGPSPTRLAILPEWYWERVQSGTLPSEPKTENKPKMTRRRAYLEYVARNALRLLSSSQPDSSDTPVSNRLDSLMKKADATTQRLEHQRSDFQVLQDEIHVEQVKMELQEALGKGGRCSSLGEEACAFGADSDDDMSDASSTDYEADDEENITDRRNLQEVGEDDEMMTLTGDDHALASSSMKAGNAQPVVLRLRGGDAPNNRREDLREIASLQRTFGQPQGNRAPPPRGQPRRRRVPPTPYQQEVHRQPVNPERDRGRRRGDPVPLRLLQDGVERALRPPRADVIRDPPSGGVLLEGSLTADPQVSPPAGGRITESRAPPTPYFQHQAQPQTLAGRRNEFWRRRIGQSPPHRHEQEQSPVTLPVPDFRTYMQEVEGVDMPDRDPEGQDLRQLENLVDEGGYGAARAAVAAMRRVIYR
ncbi:MAG: hypothetical protein Q9201_000420 [Fulgogasparrea decipioides]